MTGTLMEMAATALALVPVAGEFLSAGISWTKIMLGLSDKPGTPSEVLVNRMTNDIVGWAKDMVAYKLATSKINDMKIALTAFTVSFRRLKKYNYTDDGYGAVTYLHSQYVDNWEHFLPNFTTLDTNPEESYYEVIMSLTHTYCLSYLVVARMYIDYRKHRVERRCQLLFPPELRLSITHSDERDWGSQNPRECREAQMDLRTAYEAVNEHITLLIEHLGNRAVPALTAKYIGDPLEYDISDKVMRQNSWRTLPLKGGDESNFQTTVIAMKWSAQELWQWETKVISKHRLEMDVRCSHQFSPAFKCELKGSIREMTPNFEWSTIYGKGSECLRKLETLTEQYRSGAMKKAEQFIGVAVLDYIHVLLNENYEISRDLAKTMDWLKQHLNF
ncbi:hypothetical protein RI367_006387 [Sorochytrium milnesiophthora]